MLSHPLSENNRSVVLTNPPTPLAEVRAVDAQAHPDSLASRLDSLTIGGRPVGLTIDDFSPKTFTDRAISVFRAQPSDSAALDSVHQEILNLNPNNVSIFRNWYLNNTKVEVMLPILTHFHRDAALTLLDKVYPQLRDEVERVRTYLDHVFSDPLNGVDKAEQVFRTIQIQDRPIFESAWGVYGAQLHTSDGEAYSNTPLRFVLQSRLGDEHSNRMELFLKGFVFDDRFTQLTENPKQFATWTASCSGCAGLINLQTLAENRVSLPDFLKRQDLEPDTLKMLLAVPGIKEGPPVLP